MRRDFFLYFYCMKQNNKAVSFIAICCLCIFFVALISGCGRNHPDFTKFKRLQGSWVYASEKGNVIEAWEWVNDSLLKGKGLMVKDADTTITEYLEIQYSGKDIYYVPVVTDQNEGKPVFFRLTSVADDRYQFENPEHDFPTKIIYQLKGNDSLQVTISGPIKNEFREIEFKFRKFTEK